jgi:hypothetical protein
MFFITHQPQRALTFAAYANAAGGRCMADMSACKGMAAIKGCTLRNPKQPGSWCRQVSRDERR